MAKKQHEILVTTPEAAAKVKGFYDDKHPERTPMIMDGYGRMVVHDDGIAQEIDDRFGTKAKGGTGEVTVVTVDEAQDPGHRYTFSVPEMPWHKEKEDASNKRETEETSRNGTGEAQEGPEAEEFQGDVDRGIAQDGEQEGVDNASTNTA